jgi:hypothetical protein
MKITSGVGRRSEGQRAYRVAAAVLVATVLLVAPDDDAQARGRPDLIVTSVGISPRGGTFWATRSMSVGFTWRHRTENYGPAPAGRSETQARFDDGLDSEGDSNVVALQSVPRLASGGVKQGRGSFEQSFAGWAYGTHPMRVCADGTDAVPNERSEENNCRDIRDFYVVPYALNGRVAQVVTWHTSAATTTLSWEGDVGFDIALGAPDGNEGIFEYRYFTGSLAVSYRWSESTTGCSASGNGTYTPSRGDGLVLTFGREPRYRSFANLISQDFHFPFTMSCPGQPPQTAEFYPTYLGPLPWFHTGPDDRRFADPGLERVRGTYTSPNPSFPAQYSWNLVAQG